MSEPAVISFPVPDEGFPEMSLPVRPEQRFSEDDIKIESCKPEDLVEWSLLLYEAFPKALWDAIETKDERYSLAFRVKAWAKHWLPWLSQPGFHAIKAVHKQTGEIMGIAGWHECGPYPMYPTSYALYPGVEFPPWFVPCAWRDDLLTLPVGSQQQPQSQPTTEGSTAAGGNDELGIVARMRWTAQDLEEIKVFHSDGYPREFDGNDIARLREIGDRPHWYLAPLAVWPKWRRRGVGGALLKWGLDQADEKGWPAVLEAAPNARPVYYHFGFRPTASHGKGKDLQLVRPGKDD